MARKKKKKVNSKLLTILLVSLLPLFVIVALGIDSRRPFLPRFVHEMMGRDPVKLIAQAKTEVEGLEEYYNELKKENRAIEDPKEAAEKWEVVFEEQFAPRARNVYDQIIKAKKHSKRDVELSIQCNELIADFRLIQGLYRGNAVSSWESITKLDVNNYDAWNNLADFYLKLAENYPQSYGIDKLIECADNLHAIKPDDSKGDALGLLAKIYQLRYGLSTKILEDEGAVLTKLNELKEKFPNDPKIAKCSALYYSYQAKKSESYDRRKSLIDQAGVELKAAIDANPESVEAVLNYCKYFLDESRRNIVRELSRAGTELKKIIAETGNADSSIAKSLKIQIENLSKSISNFADSAEGEYNVFLMKYPDNAELKVARAEFLLFLPGNDFEESISFYKQALEIEPENLLWLGMAGKMEFISSLKEDQPEVKRMQAKEYLRRAYYGFNESVMTTALGSIIKATNYSEVMPFLALIDADLALQDEQAKAELKDLVNDFKEEEGVNVAITNSVEGLLAIAEGNGQLASQKLYSAISKEDEFARFTQYYAAEIRWKLFEQLKETPYKTIALENAALSYQLSPRLASDFVELLEVYLSLPGVGNKQVVVSIIEQNSTLYEADVAERNKINLIYVRALLSVGNHDKAREVLEGLEGEGREYDIYRSQVIEDEDQRMAAIEKLAQKYPGDSDIVNYLLGKYYETIKTDSSSLAKAKALMANAVAADPDNVEFIQSKLRLEEPDPLNIAMARQIELQKEVNAEIKDPYLQAMMNGKYYNTLASMESEKDNTDEASANRIKAVESFEKAAELKPDDLEPLSSLLLTYLSIKEFDKAELVVDRMKAIDSFVSEFAKIDILFAQEMFEQAEEKLSALLEENPLSARGHLVLARIYSALGRNAEAKAELETSLDQDRYNSKAIEEYLKLLNAANVAIGLDKIGPLQIEEMFSWVQQLVSVDQANLTGIQFYLQYGPLQAQIMDQQLKAATTEQEKRTILNNILIIENSVRRNISFLTSMVKDNENVYAIALQALQNLQKVESLSENHASYLSQMKSLFESALAKFPNSSRLMSNYEFFLRQTGEAGKGLDMLRDAVANAQGNDKVNAVITLANFLYRDGKQDDAKAMLVKEIANCEDVDLKQNMRMLLASLYTTEKDYDSAIEVYEQQRKEKDSDSLMTLHIEAMLDGGYSDGVEPLLNQMEEKYPDDYKVFLLRAKKALRETEYEKAIEFADMGLEKSPENISALRMKAQALFFDEKYDEAKAVIGQLQKAAGNNPNEGRLLLAQIYWRNEQFDDAILEIRKGLEIEPGNSELNLLLVQFLNGRHKWGELVDYYEGMISNNPQNPNVYLQCAKALLSWANELIDADKNRVADVKLDDALVKVNKALELDVKDQAYVSELISMKTSILLSKNKYQEVISELGSTAGLTEKSPQLSLQMIQALYRNGEKEKALTVLDKLVSTSADSAVAENILESVVRIFKPEEMISWVDSVVSNHKQKGFLYLIQAMSYRLKGDLDKFISITQKALQESEGNKSIEVLAKSRMAMAYINIEEYEKSIELYRELVKDIPESYLLLNNMAYALLSTGKNDTEALGIARRAYEMARLSPMVLDTYAMALHQNGENDKAYQIIKKAIQETKRNNDDVPLEFEYREAQILKDLGMVDDAKDILAKLLEKANASGSDAADKKLIPDIQSLLDELE